MGRRAVSPFLSRLWPLVLLCASLVWTAPAFARSFVHVRVEGVINPITARHVSRAVDRAEREQAELLLLTLDTPGGLVASMQEIVAKLSNSRVPVVGFTEPRSAQATSAGAFILLATDIAAMAPGTRVGSAHPVAEGKALDEVLDKKATNSLTALIQSLAERRGRPVDLARSMVTESVSFTAEEAKEKKLVELLAANQTELLRALNDREIRPGKRLSTRGLTRIEVPLTFVDRVLDRIADPSVTSLLISLGTLAIVYELATAGVGAGGAIGAVLLVLGLLGSSVLPIEMSAVALFVIGVLSLALEVKLPTHGVLGGAGLVGMVIAAALMVDSDAYFGGVRIVNLWLLGPIIVAAGVAMLLLGRVTSRALSEPFQTGREALVGRSGTARESFGKALSSELGQVMVDGARWQAETLEPEIHAGDAIEVVSVSTRPMRLLVRRAV
ncbi:MAG: ATP-dependent Clp protease proteolytic subunit [Myxococcota bacterium]|jgi:membrane-bound serine protease (ClpP class)|nr:ATP-dependent Clp protease proteolytic subunit [Myxococcota bacterium]